MCRDDLVSDANKYLFICHKVWVGSRTAFTCSINFPSKISALSRLTWIIHSLEVYPELSLRIFPCILQNVKSDLFPLSAYCWVRQSAQLIQMAHVFARRRHIMHVSKEGGSGPTSLGHTFFSAEKLVKTEAEQNPTRL